MANNASSSLLETSDETINGTKLMRLILDGGTEALRNVFRGIHPGNLQVVLRSNKHILSKLKGRIINQKQWDKLYPTTPKKPDINEFDITLFCVLLRNICGLSPPSSGWDIMPSPSDHTREADIVRIKLFRNVRFGHISKTAVSTADFKTFWVEISLPLVRLGIDQNEINRLENEECGEKEKIRIFNELKENDDKILNAVQDMHLDMKRFFTEDEQPRLDAVLNNNLVSFNFERDIELYCEKYTPGTREWVFDQVLTWFKDETSTNRAFVISGVAGMGKSIIAAVICKRFVEHVGASHFFQYNNSQYNNPHFFLQSLARQLCRVLPSYQDALIRKLSGKLGQSLSDMNVETLFSILFKEPFSGIANPQKPILVVLDAVDESEYYERSELANLISSHLHKLPSHIRFLITTRPERCFLEKLKKLNPMELKANDERNMNDVKLVVQERTLSINPPPPAVFINSLVERSDGLMLLAHLLSEMSKDYKDCSTILSVVDSLPKGVEGYYVNYFQRLEQELKHLKISEEEFLKFLSALAVAYEPLPKVFVASLFGYENVPPSTRNRNVEKAINTLSSLLVIKKDKSVTFSHKSVRDWLLNNETHNYSVDQQDGNKVIFNLCVKTLDKIKDNGVNSNDLVSAAVKYSLKFYIPHMLNGLEDTSKLDNLVDCYVTDLEVVFASVCVDVDLTMHSITYFLNHKLYNRVSENIRATVDRLHFLIRKFAFFLVDNTQTFLPNVVNEGGEKLSIQASTLLETRYKDIFYLELFNKDITNDKPKAHFLLSGTLSGIDVSPQHQCVVCSYEHGVIELFSLKTGESLWKLNWPIALDNCHDLTRMLPHCIVFHPHKEIILPGRLDKVFTFQGMSAKGPFQSNEESSVFTNCCFSQDGSKMVTYDGNSNNLIVWNVSSGAKETCFRSKTLYSLSFTASGDFLGTTDTENVFTVYDVTNYCNPNSIEIDTMFQVEIVSTFEKNSWFCSLGPKFQFVNHDFSQSSSRTDPVVDVVLPSNIHSSQDIKHFVEDPGHSWLPKVMRNLHAIFGWSKDGAIRYFLIDYNTALFFSCRSSNMYLLSIESFLDREEDEPSKELDIFSKISANGDFIYFNNGMIKKLIAWKIDSEEENAIPYKQSGEFDFLVVGNGVVLHGENHIPELWSADLRQLLASFDELIGTCKFLPVSDKVIACVYDKEDIKIFDVFSRKMEDQIRFPEKIRSVHACSTKSTVLVQMESGNISLIKRGKQVDSTSLSDDFKMVRLGTATFEADFSPEGELLALSSVGITKIFIYNVVLSSEIFLNGKVINIGDGCPLSGLKFFDNQRLVVGSFNHMLYVHDVLKDDVSTCLDIGDPPGPITVCQKEKVICAGLNFSKKFKLIKIRSPRN